MKGLKLPEISKEERKKAWNDLKANDIIVEIEHNYWGDLWIIKQRKVIKRTPKGYIRLDNGVLLRNFGDRYHIVTEDLKEWYSKVKLEENLINLFHETLRNKKILKNNLKYEDALKLKEILERTLNN
ncbi:hypothetical protein [Clostridium botulinum]|uniref:Uncharacterized protein n=1 Tax=Clostridium botulinum TaxID=1491 RepID=A0A6G4HNF3_CLOBO|nr:hypothetical protein [Clostridium botulinum]APH22889.1 hypothetical protein NPD1_440 [Clostridium botulinum]APH24508.1 hypothetical protein NPD1_2859 [Clostridium botulinum]APQ67413.1 hypothetical protein RSJ8_985 [Clostridium botulinum]APQ68515.1 hypothetical protein RSJ8_2642 [Clostridium botulinum]APQ69194.1 hypothetical protein RSJ8_2917 [Clostridium botulinum]